MAALYSSSFYDRQQRSAPGHVSRLPLTHARQPGAIANRDTASSLYRRQ